MVQPQGMRNTYYPHHVCRLHKVIYFGSNKLRGLGTRRSAPSYSGSALSYPMQTRPSLFTLSIMHPSISWFMLTI